MIQPKILIFWIFLTISIYAQSTSCPLHSPKEVDSNSSNILLSLHHEYKKYEARLLKEEKQHKIQMQIQKMYHFAKPIQVQEKKEKKQTIKQKVFSKKKKKKKFLYKKLLLHVDISQQRIKIYQDRKFLYKWKVSTGRKGHTTPTGRFKPLRLCKSYHSRKYNNAPMPYSIFFANGYALHATNTIWRLGKRASHGCVRLHPKHAKKLYRLVQNAGLKNTKIQIVQ